MYRHLVVALDGSESSWRALDVALDLAARAGAEVDVVSVEEESPKYVATREESAAERSEAADRRASVRQLAQGHGDGTLTPWGARRSGGAAARSADGHAPAATSATTARSVRGPAEGRVTVTVRGAGPSPGVASRGGCGGAVSTADMGVSFAQATRAIRVAQMAQTKVASGRRWWWSTAS